jgi:hypothetical protein
MHYLFFLTRRPISASNPHYLQQRLEGLQSLCAGLLEADVPIVREAVQLLSAMNPSNFYRLAERLQYTLLPLTSATTELPRDFVISDSPPPANFLAGVRRILLLFGPAIGIGDELIFAPLPGWLKAALPDSTITVMSAYAGLWDRVNGVERMLHYTNHQGALDALRGDSSVDQFDLVVFADFERPDLYHSVCYRPTIERYVELSLGAQSVFVVDNNRRWLHRTRRPVPYFANYYAGLDHLVAWLGLSPASASRAEGVVRRVGTPPDDHLEVYVNPFTSKYDPSESYWSHLLCSLVSGEQRRPVRLQVDPGPNATTERFALRLVRSASAHAPFGVEFAVAEPTGTSVGSFERIFARLERSHVVVCSDSFAAHAAPLFGCTTLVVANAGVENWRVPLERTYYFGAQAKLDEVAAGMRQILARLATSESTTSSPPAQLDSAERELEGVTRQLQLLFEHGDDQTFDAMCASYQDFARVYQTVIARLPTWPPEFRALLGDVDYAAHPRTLDTSAPVPPILRPDVVLHLQDQYQQWCNTNLRKYVGMVLGTGSSQ